MLTAYDYPTARLLDEAGIPLMLVGDSLGRVMLGYENEIPVSMADMLHHVKAVVRGTQPRVRRRGHAVHELRDDRGGARERRRSCSREGGAQAVKLEGGVRSARTIETIVARRIPVMGHIGLTPQAINAIGKVRVQGKTKDAAAIPARRRAGGPGGRRVRGRARAGARAAGRGDHRAAAHPDDRDRGGRRVLGPGPGRSRTCSASRGGIPGTRGHTPTSAASILDAARRYAADVGAGTFPSDAETVRDGRRRARRGARALVAGPRGPIARGHPARPRSVAVAVRRRAPARRRISRGPLVQLRVVSHHGPRWYDGAHRRRRARSPVRVDSRQESPPPRRSPATSTARCSTIRARFRPEVRDAVGLVLDAGSRWSWPPAARRGSVSASSPGSLGLGRGRRSRCRARSRERRGRHGPPHPSRCHPQLYRDPRSTSPGSHEIDPVVAVLDGHRAERRRQSNDDFVAPVAETHFTLVDDLAVRRARNCRSASTFASPAKLPRRPPRSRDGSVPRPQARSRGATRPVSRVLAPGTNKGEGSRMAGGL